MGVKADSHFILFKMKLLTCALNMFKTEKKQLSQIRTNFKQDYL